MTRLGLIVRLLFRALVNTLFVLALLASAAIVLLWIIGRNKQLQERRQRRRYGANASPRAEEQQAGLWPDPPTPFGSIVSPTQDVPPRRLSFSTGQGGAAFGAQTGVAAAPQEAPGVTAHAPASTPVAAGTFGGRGRSDAGRTTPGSSARRVSFLLTPEQERRVSTGGSLWDSGDSSDRVPSSPRVVVTRLAGQPTGENMATAAAAAAPEGPGGRTGARVDSGSSPVSADEPVDTRAPSSSPRSSRKGGKGGLTQRRARFGGEVARRPISKKSQAAVLSSSAWTAGGGSSGPLSRKQLDSRLFTSVSLRSQPLAGAAGDGRAGRSGAHDSDSMRDRGDIGVVCEDSTETITGGKGDGGSRANSSDASGADSGDNGDDVDQCIIYPSGFKPQSRTVDGSSAATASTNPPPSRLTATNPRMQKMLASAIQKASSSSTATAAAAARRSRLIRGSSSGTQPVPMPRSLSSASALLGTAGVSSRSTVAWERSRRAAAARVARMLADADAAEAAASAVASQSEAHLRAAAAAEAAAASVRAQAAAEETELLAQQPGLRREAQPLSTEKVLPHASVHRAPPQSEASPASAERTAQPVQGAKRRQLHQQSAASQLGSRAPPASLFEQLGPPQQQPHRAYHEQGQASAGTADLSRLTRRAPEGGFSSADRSSRGDHAGSGPVSSVPTGGFGTGSSPFSSAPLPRSSAPPSHSAAAPVSSCIPSFDVSPFLSGGLAPRSGGRPVALPTSVVVPSFARNGLSLTPNGSSPANGAAHSSKDSGSSRRPSQPPSISFGAPTPRTLGSNGTSGFGGNGAFGGGPTFGQSAGKDGDIVPASKASSGGAFGGGFGGSLTFGGASLGGAPALRGARAPNVASTAPAGTDAGAVSGGLKRSPSQLALEAVGGAAAGGAARGAAGGRVFQLPVLVAAVAPR
ncbi:hypothetical protein BU14_0185s0007 [Porphyra umbilicalis]|uniref:Uncharacterized protein n=1 Tax=Porphyra umbilicalis TaxID=2786 RepID=A0A1X6P6S4_PORUM|nr:hypothetical protein BU14_0185s0007 [Porphyra umbilicalis]|eukprot:OSX76548.1 hypothetical protein BU14_0185s0007 [Porphyra umbilicalis]